MHEQLFWFLLPTCSMSGNIYTIIHHPKELVTTLSLGIFLVIFHRRKPFFGIFNYLVSKERLLFSFIHSTLQLSLTVIAFSLLNTLFTHIFVSNWTADLPNFLIVTAFTFTGVWCFLKLSAFASNTLCPSNFAAAKSSHMSHIQRIILLIIGLTANASIFLVTCLEKVVPVILFVSSIMLSMFSIVQATCEKINKSTFIKVLRQWNALILLVVLCLCNCATVKWDSFCVI